MTDAVKTGIKQLQIWKVTFGSNLIFRLRLARMLSGHDNNFILFQTSQIFPNLHRAISVYAKTIIHLILTLLSPPGGYVFTSVSSYVCCQDISKSTRPTFM